MDPPARFRATRVGAGEEMVIAEALRTGLLLLNRVPNQTKSGDQLHVYLKQSEDRNQ